MSPDEFRREIRVVPTNRSRVIVLPDFSGDLAPTQLSTEGEYVDTISKQGIEIIVRSPKVSLFFLEEPPINVGDDMYDKSAAFGVDERYDAKSGKLPLTPKGLEALIEAFIVRTIELETKAEGRANLNQFYPIATFLVYDKKLTGRLLASKAIAPTIETEIKTADHYFDSKGHGVRRCLYCDIAETEIRSMQESEHRVILANESFVSFVPYAALDQHTIHIHPRRIYHNSRFTKMTEEQKRVLAEMMYDSAMRILSARPRRFFDLLNISIHSAPQQHNGENGTRTTNPLGQIYDFHVEVSPGKIPPYGAPFDIAHSGWHVEPGRPKDIAQTLREVSYNHP